MSSRGIGLTIADKTLNETVNKVNSGELDMVGVKNFYDNWAEKYDQVNSTKHCDELLSIYFYFLITL